MASWRLLIKYHVSIVEKKSLLCYNSAIREMLIKHFLRLIFGKSVKRLAV